VVDEPALSGELRWWLVRMVLGAGGERERGKVRLVEEVLCETEEGGESDAACANVPE